MSDESVPVHEIPAHLGVEPGTVLLVGSDTFRLAYNAWCHGEAFDADRFIDALRDVVGPDGTLLFPTFTLDEGPPVRWDRVSGPVSTGALSRRALEHEDFRRTGHPIHSFAVAGALRETLCAVDDPSSFGPESVFAALRRHRATMLIIGLDYQRSFTFVHHVEEMEGVWYRRLRRFPVEYTNTDGKTTTRTFASYVRRRGVYSHVNGIGAILERAGVARRRTFGGEPFIDIDLAAAYDVIAEDIRKRRGRNLHCLLPTKAIGRLRRRLRERKERGRAS